MSLEAKIDLLTGAITSLIVQLQQNPVAAPVPPSAPAPVAAPAAPIAEAVILPSPSLPAPPVAAPAAPAMPAPPTFAPPVAVNATIPFSDTKTLTDYVMATYRDLAPDKGAQIQTVLTSLGYNADTDVQPDKYAQFFAGVEALRG